MAWDLGITEGEGVTRAPVADCDSWVAALSGLDVSGLDEGRALELVTVLERVKRAACAAQARLSVRVESLARERQRVEEGPPVRLGAGVGAQVALARLESPHRGGRHLGLAKALVSELPETLRAMGQGDVSEWQATLVARETACVDAETRRAIDARIGDRLATWGDRQTVREIRKLVYAADPALRSRGTRKPRPIAVSRSARRPTPCAT